MLFSCAVCTVFCGQILCMTSISDKIEFNFFLEIKSGLFYVCALILLSVYGSHLFFLSHYYLDPDIGGITETVA